MPAKTKTKPRATKKPARTTKAAAKKAEPSPVKSVAEELESLRKTLREVVKNYSNRIESEIADLRAIVLGLTETAESLPTSRMHELRDMLTLMRTLQVKEEKGRRKDVKKIDDLVADLRQFVDGWK